MNNFGLETYSMAYSIIKDLAKDKQGEDLENFLYLISAMLLEFLANNNLSNEFVEYFNDWQVKMTMLSDTID